MELSEIARRELGEHIAPRRIEELAEAVRGICDAPAAPHVTSKSARIEAQTMADHALHLVRAIESGPIAGSLGMVDRIVRGQSSLNDGHLERLCVDLRALREACLSVLKALDGDDSAPQIELPSRGRAPGKERSIASAVMWCLHTEGIALSATDTGAAVRCVETVFRACGNNADARHHVREWLTRHPESDRGGREV